MKQSHSLYQMMLSKIKEINLKQKYDQEKYQLAMETKFKSLITQREQEWERAWEKRDSVLANKDSLTKELDAERTTLRELLGKREAEVASYQQQVSTMVRDHASIVEDFKSRVSTAERKYDELLQQYHRHEDKLMSTNEQQLSDLQDQLTAHYHQEVAHL